MNGRLLSEDEKRWNRKARQRRHTQQQAARRRRLAPGTLCDPALAATESILGPQQSCAWLWAGELRTVKRAIRRLNAAAVASDPRVAVVPTSVATCRMVPRPVRVLREANRGAVAWLRRRLVAAPVEFLGLESTLLAAGELAGRGSGPAEILNFMADPLASGLSFEACAELAFAAGIFHSPVNAELLDTMNRATAYQSLMADGRDMYNALVTNGEITPAAGTWAFFSNERLHEFLPGLRLPSRLRRDEYLINLIAGADGNPVCIDLHGIRHKPICRHPLH